MILFACICAYSCPIFPAKDDRRHRFPWSLCLRGWKDATALLPLAPRKDERLTGNPTRIV